MTRLQAIKELEAAQDETQSYNTFARLEDALFTLKMADGPEDLQFARTEMQRHAAASMNPSIQKVARLLK